MYGTFATTTSRTAKKLGWVRGLALVLATAAFAVVSLDPSLVKTDAALARLGGGGSEGAGDAAHLVPEYPIQEVSTGTDALTAIVTQEGSLTGDGADASSGASGKCCRGGNPKPFFHQPVPRYYKDYPCDVAPYNDCDGPKDPYCSTSKKNCWKCARTYQFEWHYCSGPTSQPTPQPTTQPTTHQPTPQATGYSIDDDGEVGKCCSKTMSCDHYDQARCAGPTDPKCDESQANCAWCGYEHHPFSKDTFKYHFCKNVIDPSAELVEETMTTSYSYSYSYDMSYSYASGTKPPPLPTCMPRGAQCFHSRDCCAGTRCTTSFFSYRKTCDW